MRGSHGTTDGRPAEIAEGLFNLGPWGRTQTNVYVVRSGDSWVVVDAGWAKDGPRITDSVRRLIGTRKAPAGIVLTHCHPDHSGAAGFLAAAWGCRVHLARDELPIAAGDFAAMTRWAGPLDRWVILPTMRAMGQRRRDAVLARSRLRPPALVLPPDGTVPLLPDWRAVPTPGHTPGHVSFFRPADRVLVSGDALVTLRLNAAAGVLWGAQGLSGPPWYTTWDRAAARRSVAALAELRPEVVAGGHGHPLTGPGTAEAVEAFATGH